MTRDAVGIISRRVHATRSERVAVHVGRTTPLADMLIARVDLAFFRRDLRIVVAVTIQKTDS